MAATILVVDDSHVDRCLIRGLLLMHPQWEVELAENGQVALERIAAARPDVVVTDLMMPELDGLSLVRAVRRQFPDIPVILLTGYGNETVAVEALQCGAASYVPKARQAERLVETVERVLEHAASDRCRDRVARSVLEYNLRLQLDNDPALIRALVDQVQEMMAAVEFADLGERIRVAEAVEEAMLNAMYHGNLEIRKQELDDARAELDGRRLASLVEMRRLNLPFRGRKILINVRVSATEARLVIRDQGKGFNVGLVTGGDKTYAFENGNNRGLTLIQSLMDEVRFNDGGNELVMCKRRPAPIAAHLMQQS